MASYATVQNIRDQGLTDVAAYPDAVVQAGLDAAKQVINRLTRQWFESLSLDFKVDGNDSRILHLPVPIVSIEALYLNGDFTTVINPIDYVAYNGVAPVDDRQNPKIALVSKNRSIFVPPSMDPRAPLFIKGRQNQRLVGHFGYLEADGSCPALIKRATIKLALQKYIPQLAPYGVTPAPPGGFKTGETTDGHNIQFAMPPQAGLKAGSFAMTGDSEVDYIIATYRAPIGMAVPGSENIEAG